MALTKKQKKIGLWVGGIIFALLIILLSMPAGISRVHAITRMSGASSYGGGDSAFAMLLSVFRSELNIEEVAVCEESYDSCILTCDEGLLWVDDGEDCYDLCDDAYETCFFDSFEDITEGVTWNGVKPTDINAFFENGYPMFYESSRWWCEDFIFGGVWVDSANKVGCTEGWMLTFGCDSESIQSALDVCNTIGGTVICTDDEITCSID